MSTPTKVSPLRHLVNILSDAVTQIDEKYASANLEFPTLDKPFDEKDPACLLLSDPDMVPLSSVVVAAADQLIASARHPMHVLIDFSQFVSLLPLLSAAHGGYWGPHSTPFVGQYTIPSCLRLACESNVPEILREAGPGVSIFAIHVSPVHS